MKSAQPNKKEKDWRENVRLSGSIVSGYRPCQIHHVAGRTAKHQGAKVGHLLILPLCYDEHSLIDRGALGLQELKERLYWRKHIHGDEEVGRMSLHEFEKYLFSLLCKRVEFPFSETTYQKCMDWHR